MIYNFDFARSAFCCDSCLITVPKSPSLKYQWSNRSYRYLLFMLIYTYEIASSGQSSLLCVPQSPLRTQSVTATRRSISNPPHSRNFTMFTTERQGYPNMDSREL